MFKCLVCEEEFEDSGDLGLHLIFGHNLGIDTDHPKGITRKDVDPSLHELMDEIDKQKEVKDDGSD